MTRFGYILAILAVSAVVFAADGKLYESEHGPNTDDEVNLIRAGGNYGWPHVAGYRDDQSYAYAEQLNRQARECLAGISSHYRDTLEALTENLLVREH